jgi:hypothetical protein
MGVGAGQQGHRPIPAPATRRRPTMTASTSGSRSATARRSALEAVAAPIPITAIASWAANLAGRAYLDDGKPSDGREGPCSPITRQSQRRAGRRQPLFPRPGAGRAEEARRTPARPMTSFRTSTASGMRDLAEAAPARRPGRRPNAERLTASYRLSAPRSAAFLAAIRSARLVIIPRHLKQGGGDVARPITRGQPAAFLRLRPQELGIVFRHFPTAPACPPPVGPLPPRPACSKGRGFAWRCHRYPAVA